MCDDRERLIGYVYDDCDSEERRAVEAHLAECPDCRREIADLRSVRQDLLAWDVPNHESVWRPFTPTRPAFAWNQFPAWAMAAAASVVLAIGAAGGVATHAWLASDAPNQMGAASGPSGLTAADMQALERRVLATMRSEMDERVRLALLREQPAMSPAPGAGREVAQLASEIAQVNQRLGLMQTRVNEIGNRQVDWMQVTNQDLVDTRSAMSRIIAVAQPGPTAGFGVR